MNMQLQPPFDFTLSYSESGWTLGAAGDLDLASADTVIEVAAELAHHHPRALKLDLSRVTFIDSAGCSGLAAAMAVLEDAGVATTIGGVSPSVNRYFDLVRPPDRGPRSGPQPAPETSR
jgi:anti-anti-sigma factor